MNAVIKMESPRITSYDLRKAVALRYCPPEWHIESEVTLAGRRLDLVALNMWAARRFRIVGFELKVSRGDWLRELSAFQKSEEWTAVVDAFYIVTPPKLVKDEELPAGWGLLELCGSRMMTRRHATASIGTELPREVAARFISRLATETRNANSRQEWEATRKLRGELETSIRASLAAETASDRSELSRLREDHSALLKALGIDPMQWEKEKSALRAAGIFAASRSDTTTLRMRLEQNAKAMEGHAARMREALAALEIEAEL